MALLLLLWIELLCESRERSLSSHSRRRWSMSQVSHEVCVAAGDASSARTFRWVNLGSDGAGTDSPTEEVARMEAAVARSAGSAGSVLAAARAAAAGAAVAKAAAALASIFSLAVTLAAR